jgi:RNA polymerase sigma factor (sigma-70 family)
MVAVSLTQSHLRLLTDERLARLVGLGSEAAFAVLYGRHRRDLERYTRALVHDAHDADDGLQSAMLKAYAALREARRDAPVRPWLFRIAHNEAMTVHRRRATAPTPRDPELVTVAALASDVHDQVVARDELRGVIAGLELLTAHQRAALLMRRLGGLGYDEIAVALDTTPVAARQAVSTARKRLSEHTSRGPLARVAALLPVGPLSALLRCFSEAATVSPGGGGRAAAAVATVAVVAGVGAADVAEKVTAKPERKRARTVTVASAPAAATRVLPAATATARFAVARTVATPMPTPTPAARRTAVAKRKQIREEERASRRERAADSERSVDTDAEPPRSRRGDADEFGTARDGRRGGDQEYAHESREQRRDPWVAQETDGMDRKSAPATEEVAAEPDRVDGNSGPGGGSVDRSGPGSGEPQPAPSQP